MILAQLEAAEGGVTPVAVARLEDASLGDAQLNTVALVQIEDSRV